MGNAAWAAYTRVKVVGLNTTGGIEDLVSGARFVPRSPQSFAYDADGNLVSDGQWGYSWDAENRLIQMETREAGTGSGVGQASFLDKRQRRVGAET